jgi:erythromycin esterase-like protein
VVMLGEATHGTEEFYRIRRDISERLIADHGFKFIAVEGDWPDCYKLNRYIETGEGGSAKKIMASFKRWPTWMWANYQTAELIEWLRKNGGNFYGLDVYSLYDSLEIIKQYISQVDQDLAEKIDATYSCFEPFERSEISYGRELVKYPEGCQQEILKCLQQMLRTRVEETHLSNAELFDARQNATIIQNAERYYRATMFGGAESWNVRDRHMMDTLDALLRRHGEGAKAIVWAHNTHIGDYHATDMVDEGYVNLGGLARERYGIENVHLVGLGT